MKFPLHVLVAATYGLLNKNVFAALEQGQESDYLANFEAMQAASYSVLEDQDKVPPNLISECKNNFVTPIREVTVEPTANGYINSSQVSQQCGIDSVCTVPFGTTLQVDTSINLGALIVRGRVEWNDDTQVDSSAYVCAGYVAVEGHGTWEMDLQDKEAFIYLKDNGATHDHLRTRAFGSYAMSSSDYPVVDINGRELVRTWSLLAAPLEQGEDSVKLMHNPKLMGWRVGDRIGISPTEVRATGHGEEFTITSIDDDGTLQLSKNAEYHHGATFVPGTRSPALLSSEVVNLSRNIVITGDDFKHVTCDSSLPEAVPGEQTSTLGCRCASFRTTCTMGLHTAIMHGGEAKISNIRVEKCGQRGVEGKYCMHFHKLSDCPTCVFKNNAIENSHQRGIIVHSTHSSVAEQNVLYNVRGSGIYIEDGNEMFNDIKYNVVICPFTFQDTILHGCTIPGTSNRIADTSDNQSGIFSRASTNGLIGNRVSNSFNGMLLDAGSIGRGDSYGKVCEADAILGRIEGNTFHGNGRFGTYTLGGNYAKTTDQSINTNGHNIDKSLCDGFDSQGYARGKAGSIVDNVDYHNTFVGHYEAGEIQYVGHQSFDNNELIYWKETKNFANGCSAHITGGSYARGGMALPDQSTFIIESTYFGDGVSIEANHHCNVGTTGVLCFPQYIFHDIIWNNSDTSKKWIWFQNGNTQGHTANQNHGGVFTLSPPNVEAAMKGLLESSIFPPGYVSLVSNKFTYLLSLPGNICTRSSDISSLVGMLYSDGILCKVPLRSLKIYTRGLVSGSAPSIKVEMWYDKGGIESQTMTPDALQDVGFHQVGGDNSSRKQGYSFPVIPNAAHSYRVSLNAGNGEIPSDWVVEFSDHVMANRFGSIEYTNLSLNGTPCGINGLVNSQHDRRYIWSGDNFLSEQAWGNTGACAAGLPPDTQQVDCGEMNHGVLSAQECPDLCNNECDVTSSFCDCGSATCKCKPGFYGDNCSSDLCSAARCGDHGTCTAKYLGGDLPVTTNACICDDGWSGSLCQFNPCVTLGKTCSHGTCVATSDTEAECVCDAGFSGEDCNESCDGICIGTYPFGCAMNLNDVERYGCHPSGGCNYLKAGEEYPYSGFCTYKIVAQDEDCVCGDDNECELSRSCNADGSCSIGQFLPDYTPCNSIPFGTCQSGVCTQMSSTSLTSSPSSYPSIPTTPPTSSPTMNPLHCMSLARKVKIESTTKTTIQFFEVQVYSLGSNVALRKSATQSSTLRSFHASRAVDGELTTPSFSHTDSNDSNAWWEVDLDGLYDIEEVRILNRYCRSSDDPKGCLCRLSHATLSLLDENNAVVATRPLGDTCNQLTVTEEFCSNLPIPSPTKSPSSVLSPCGSQVRKVKIESTTGRTVQMFEVQVYSLGSNVALRKSATQSSTLRSFHASRAVDGGLTTPSFSHTDSNDSNAWWEVDLNGLYDIEEVRILNRYCRSSDDPKGCLCRLSHATLSLLDENNAVVATRPLGDTCNQLTVTEEFCLDPPTVAPTISTKAPVSMSPSRSPTTRPSTSPSLSPTTHPSNNPIRLTSNPTQETPIHCGCSSCTDSVWNTPAIDGASDQTCGARINWLQTPEGGSMSETDACTKVAGLEFKDGPCGPWCDPSRCNLILEDPDPSTLIWADEFDEDGLPDPTKWGYDMGDGCSIELCNWGNGEVAYYTNSTSNVHVSNGILSIVAKKEAGFSLPYTSARMVTRGKHFFKYGRVQFRANLSKCKALGTWPALWMLPEYKVYGGWPRSGEIDVMETVGHEANKFFGTVHTEAYNGQIGSQKGSSISVSKDEWHVFEINWEVDRIQFGVDKQIYFEYQRGDSSSVWPFDQEFHLIMNVAVGGTWGGQNGIDSDAFTGSGQIMEVDWVRVYGEAAPTGSPSSPLTNPPIIHCGCSSCTEAVWNSPASDGAGTFTCGARIDWLQSPAGGPMSEFEACKRVAGVEFPNGPCGPHCDPTKCT